MAQDEDRTALSFDDLPMDLSATEGRPYEALCRWSERYPRYYKEIAESCATDAIKEMYEKSGRRSKDRRTLEIVAADGQVLQIFR